MKKILFLAANPVDTSRLRFEKEVKEFDEALKRSNFSNLFTVDQRWAVKSRTLRRALLEVKPQIVHFCGHSEGSIGLTLEDDIGAPKLLSTEALASLFEIFSDKIECVLFSACYAEHQAKMIVQHIDYIIGMNHSIEDTTAIAFSVGFYDALGAGKSIEKAYQFGCTAIHLGAGAQTSPSGLKAVDDVDDSQNIEKHLVPVLLKKRDFIENLLEQENAAKERITQLDKSIESIAQKFQADRSLIEALEWLGKRQSLSQKASDHVFQTVSTVQEWSNEDKEEFRWEIEKYLEIIYYALLTNSNDLLKEPPITPSYDNPLSYLTAFSYVKNRISSCIDIAIQNRIKNNFDYLYERIFE